MSEQRAQESLIPTGHAERLNWFRQLAHVVHLGRCTRFPFGDCHRHEEAEYFTPKDNDIASVVIKWLEFDASVRAAVDPDAAVGCREVLNRKKQGWSETTAVEAVEQALEANGLDGMAPPDEFLEALEAAGVAVVVLPDPEDALLTLDTMAGLRYYAGTEKGRAMAAALLAVVQ